MNGIQTNINMTAHSLPPSPATPDVELARRLDAVRTGMVAEKVDFIILTDIKNIQYFTDFRTLSWVYNARPIFAIVTHEGLLLVASLIDARIIESRDRPFEPCYYDGYLAEAVQAIVEYVTKNRTAGASRIAVDYGQDMLGRGSLDLIDSLRETGGSSTVISATDLLWRVRMVKSPFEAALKRTAFGIVNSAFDQVIADAYLGISEYELCQRLQAQIFLNGAERADPIAMLFSRGDFLYGRLPSERRLEAGHYIWTDFRATYGGYPADQNRTARAGEPGPSEVSTYKTVRGLTLQLVDSVRAGMTCGDLYATFERLWAEADLGNVYGLVSRIGHGGGLDVTEPPSISRNNPQIIHPGMILHIEPKLERDGAVFQFEEVIYVGEDKVEFLSVISPDRIPVISRSSPIGEPSDGE